jgi:hypothetical protein
MTDRPQIFLSYAGPDGFEADLLQTVLERVLADLNVLVWTYERDQPADQRGIGESLRDRVRESRAAVILLSRHTLDFGATQWMELAYADAFNVPTFILLHHMTFAELRKSDRGIPPLVLESQCTPAREWQLLERPLRRCCRSTPETASHDPTVLTTPDANDFAH